MSGKNSIQVGIKVRPLLRKEKDLTCWWRVVENSIALIDSQSDPYYFDHIFDQDANNDIIFDKMARQIVHAAVQGFNGTIFAYGQTSSGKTYTMMGSDENPGVMVLAAKEIFKQIEETTDRQFLLRVGYIEIYNEKIYDLLNKKNQDLKIHETATGIVSVNCEENIIMCEDDLLHYLRTGSKERTVGETNMNERSSRSHAIFRIIIESRKMDRSEDDSVIQSVLNLVDLAGSERADQTGARGARLKEGGHINKSLLFLSNVIKRLSENEDDKYISYRDSKLTRILQASLGGNSLTAIICTIQPTAVEETQSTLNFALRAKSIKNKPKVNEIVSDATMMKRLEKEIKDLKTRLAEERSKNESQIKVAQIEQRIRTEVLKIISCNSLHTIRNQREKRRRTWCPSVSNSDTNQPTLPPSALPVPTMMPPSSTTSQYISRIQPPKPTFYHTPLITMRPVEPATVPVEQITELDEEDQFAPGELCSFKMASPLQSPKDQTESMLQRKLSITPKVTGNSKASLENIEHELLELQGYTNLENKNEVQYRPNAALKEKLDTLTSRNAVLENERLEYIQLKDEIVFVKQSLGDSEKRCDDLRMQVSKLTDANGIANARIAEYEKELAELKGAIAKLEMENREAVSLEFEFQRHKNKSKLRENELLEALAEKDKEISKLEKSLKSVSVEKLQNSKEELLQLSRIYDVDKVCVQCEDLQRLLEENKKVTREFNKLTLEYEQLQFDYTQVSKEATAAQTRIDELEQTGRAERAECVKLQSDIATLRDKLEAVQREYEQLNCDNSAKIEECEALNRQVEVARADMRVLQEKYDKLEHVRREQQQMIDDIQAQYDAVQLKYESLQVQYEQLQQSSVQSLEECRRLQKENETLQSEINELKVRVKQAQQKLLETTENTACKEGADYAELKQENANLRHDLSEIQTQFGDLQREYDDLSNQLMDSLQESEVLKGHCTRMEEKVKALEEDSASLAVARAEINELKLQLERTSSMAGDKQLRNYSSCGNASMQSSGVCVEDEGAYSDRAELLSKFVQLSESLAEIELEHVKGRSRVFKARPPVSPATMPPFRLLLRNIEEVTIVEKEHELELSSCTTPLRLEGVLKRHSFHFVELGQQLTAIETSECTADGSHQEYIAQLKQEIKDLKESNEQERAANKALLENTERSLSEMREQITRLTAELLEKSIFVENCSCDSYQKQIESLERERAEMTLVCEELRERVNDCTSESLSGMADMTLGDAERDTISREELNEIERLRNVENELQAELRKSAQLIKDLEHGCSELETELNATQQQLETNKKDHKDKYNQLQLEILEKMDLSANEYRDNLRKYNQEWEKSRDNYEKTIAELQQQLEALGGKDQENSLSCVAECEKIDRNAEEQREGEKKAFVSEPELSEEQKSLREEHIKLKEENFVLQEKCTELKEEIVETRQQLSQLKEKEVQLINNVQELEIKLSTLMVEQKQLKEEKEVAVKDFENLNAIKEDVEAEHKALLQQLKVMEDEVEEKHNLKMKCNNLELERSALEEKLSVVEAQLQGFCNEGGTREEELQSLQEQVRNLMSAEQEKIALESVVEVLRSEGDELRAQNKDLTEQLSRITEERQKTEKRLCEINEKEASQGKIFKDQIEILTQEKEDLKKQIQLLNEQKEILNKELETVQDEKTSLEDRLKQMEEIVEESRMRLKEVEMLVKERDDLEKNSDRLQGEVSILREEQLAATQKMAELQQSREEQMQIIKSLESQLEKMQLEVDKKRILEETVATLTTTSESLRLEKCELEKQLTTVSSEIESVRTNKEMLDAELRAQRKENSSIKEEREVLLEQLKHLKEKENAAELLEKTRLEKEDLMHNLRICNEQLEDAKRKLSELEEKSETHQRLYIALEEQLKSSELIREKEKHALQDEKIKIEEELTRILEGKQALEEKMATSFEKNSEQEKRIESLEMQLTTFEDLRNEKMKLEERIEILKEEHAAELALLRQECDALKLKLKQFQAEKNSFDDTQETLRLKVESLSQQLHEARSKADAYEQLIAEHSEVETELEKATHRNAELNAEIARLQSTLAEQQEQHEATSQTQAASINCLEEELRATQAEEKSLRLKLAKLEDNLTGEQNAFKKEHKELRSAVSELQLKCETLHEANERLKSSNLQLEEELKIATEKAAKCSILQGELSVLRIKHAELQKHMETTAEEASRYSKSLRDDLQHHKRLLEKQSEAYSSLRLLLKKKEEEKEKLSSKLDVLVAEKQALELKIRELTVRSFKQDLQRTSVEGTTCVEGDGSMDSSSSSSPRSRKSVERVEEKHCVLQQKSTTSAERKNRRLSTHDERRRQSYWGATRDVETLTDPIDTSCNCVELDRKLQECERNLFIRESQVTALNMELKNHPLKAENATLMKRLQEEQDRNRIEIKRYKQKLSEQSAKIEKALCVAATVKSKEAESDTTPKVLANIEVQTETDLGSSLQILQGKYNDLKNICRHRYNVIRELEEKVAQKENADSNVPLSGLEAGQVKVLKSQCESLKKELAVIKDKYEKAKVVLHSRREQIQKLSAQLEQANH